jgi:tetratricopeptide (TPR) repeat protein
VTQPPVPPTEEDDYIPATHLVESGRPFSQSFIWEMQRRYYEIQGIEAWSENRIPFAISTGPVIAHAYAMQVYALLQDLQGQLDPSEPLYIIEVGSGSGRLGFHFLKEFWAYVERTPYRSLDIKYILTDMPEKNIAFWRTQSQLRESVKQGRLDFARFDALQDNSITLLESGKVLRAGELKNPLVLCANYLLDTLPQDMFSLERPSFYEVSASLYSTQPEPDIYDPEVITRIEIEYDRHEVSTDYYPDPSLNVVLKHYYETMPNSTFIFPRASIELLRTFQKLSGGRMLLLSADKGDHRQEELVHEIMPPIVLHDNGFSMQFNYHALALYLEQTGGHVFKTSFRHANLNILTFAQGLPSMDHLALAYEEYVEFNNPDDNFAAMIEVDKRPNVTVPELMAYMRLKRYDSYAFLLVFGVMRQKFNNVSTMFLPSLKLMAAHIWENYYHIGERFNIPFYLGALLSSIREYQDAVFYYERAIEMYGREPHTLYNLSASYTNLGRLDEALALIDEVQANAPQIKEAVKQRQVILEAMQKK